MGHDDEDVAQLYSNISEDRMAENFADFDDHVFESNEDLELMLRYSDTSRKVGTSINGPVFTNRGYHRRGDHRANASDRHDIHAVLLVPTNLFNLDRNLIDEIIQPYPVTLPKTATRTNRQFAAGVSMIAFRAELFLTRLSFPCRHHGVCHGDVLGGNTG